MSVVDTSGKLHDPMKFSPEEQGLASNHAILSSMVLSKQDQLRLLQQQIVVEQTRLKRMQEDQATQRSQQSSMMAIERDQHQKAMQDELLSQKRQGIELESRALQLDAREKDLQQLVAQADAVLQMRKEAEERSLSAEQLRVQANDLLRDANVKMHEAEMLGVNLNVQAEQNKRDAKQLQAWNLDLEARQVKVQASESSTATNLQNLQSLRETLDPKIQEYTALKEKAESESQRASSLLSEAMQKQAEVEQQKADLAGLSQRLNAKEAVLVDYEMRLKSLKSELEIKAQQLKAQGEKTPEVPPVPETVSSTTGAPATP